MRGLRKKEDSYIFNARKIAEKQRLIIKKILVLQAGNSSSWLGTETSMFDSTRSSLNPRRNSTMFTKTQSVHGKQSAAVHEKKRSRSHSLAVNAAGRVQIVDAFESRFGTFTRKDALQDPAYTTVTAMLDAKHELSEFCRDER